MKKQILIIILLTALISTSCASININNLPDGILFNTELSPNGTYCINAYLSINSLSSDAIRCEVVEVETQKSKNIYWHYPWDSKNTTYINDGEKISDVEVSNFSILWLDDDTVNINGVELDVLYDHYDWRN